MTLAHLLSACDEDSEYQEGLVHREHTLPDCVWLAEHIIQNNTCTIMQCPDVYLQDLIAFADQLRPYNVHSTPVEPQARLQSTPVAQLALSAFGCCKILHACLTEKSRFMGPAAGFLLRMLAEALLVMLRTLCPVMSCAITR